MSNGEMNDFNTRMIEEFRANHGVVSGPFEGAPMILVTHKGAKTGQERTTPLVHTRDGDRYVVVASKGGAPTNPAWFHNIKANPRVTVEVGDERFDADAEIYEDGPERRRLFDQQADQMPGFSDYEQKASRVIPVVALTRAG
jgi:deazaflavin-dependent oxidoreductase (nitroreductase family)